MDDSFTVAGVNQIVDDSHKYTTVYTEDRLGSGGAHQKYAIRDKEGKLLGWLKFQEGSIKEAGINGINNENLLAIVIDRLRGFQDGQFACRENRIALDRVEEALMWLQKRTADRMKRGVEGQTKV